MNHSFHEIIAETVAEALRGATDDGGTAMRRLTAAITGGDGVGTITVDLAANDAANERIVVATGGAGADHVIVLNSDLSVRRFDASDGSASFEVFEDLGSGSSAHVHLSGDGIPVDTEHRALLAAMRLVLAATLTGTALRVLELTRTHVRKREQFGAPLIAIPTVAGNVARMRVAHLQATAAIARALGRHEDRITGTDEAIAWMTAVRSATEIARLAHQLHGAIGIRDDNPLPALTRRIWALRDLLGPDAPPAAALGRWGREHGEDALWDRMTQPA